MNEYIDLVVVEYLRGGTEICYAPSWEVKNGDAVVTEFGEGKVVETLFTSVNDKMFKFFDRNMKIRPVLYKPIKYYEEENNDLSERRDD